MVIEQNKTKTNKQTNTRKKERGGGEVREMRIIPKGKSRAGTKIPIALLHIP